MSNLLNLPNPVGRLVRCRRGDAGVVITVIVVIAAIAIGAIVLAGLQDGVPNVANEQANSTITAVFDGGWNAYRMLLVIPIIIAAVAIFSYLYMFGGASGGRR